MKTPWLGTAELVFFVTLAVTFGAAIFARCRTNTREPDEDLAGRGLNKWLIGLSAGTTGNSGFIVTGAVGLGYVGGIHWLMLPISWLLGDLVFWTLFPARLNRLARKARATTLSEMLTFDLTGGFARGTSIIVAMLLVVFLATYTAAQWLAGRKFLSGIFEISDLTALIAFAATIVAYSSLGGFRGSVYTDLVQAIIRIIGTGVALGAVLAFASSEPSQFMHNITGAGPDFLKLFPNGTLVSVVGFVLGFAGAAIGFGLGQPQIVSRYFAGKNPEETRAAMWIYLGFLQATWISMTIFGVILRGVMPSIADPETGLSVFFEQHIGAIATGIIFADVFATIASTSNGILVAMAQALLRDILPTGDHARQPSRIAMTLVTVVLGFATIILSLSLPGTVFSIAIDSLSKIGAGVAGAVVIKCLGWKHSALSLFMSIIAGIAVAFVWTHLGFDTTMNGAGVGILASLVTNWLFCAFSPNPAKYSAAQTE
ncbi:MAG TPA: hypothetical protein VHU23_01655 [Rhizomicrobium sp.]|nr:hypothetical protein [Rhizomicrobium sp.]